MPRARAALRWLLFLGGVVYLLPRDSRLRRELDEMAETCRILSGDPELDRDLDARP